MFKNILSIVVMSAVATTAFAKGGKIGKSVERTETEKVHTGATNKAMSNAEKVQVMLAEAAKSSDVAQRELSLNIKAHSEVLARLSPETLNVLTIDGAKAAEANKILTAEVFADADGQKAAAVILQRLVYTANMRPAAEIIENAIEYKADAKIFEAYITLERELARVAKDSTATSKLIAQQTQLTAITLTESMELDALATARSILRGSTSRNVKFKDLSPADQKVVRELNNELKKNGCLNAVKA